MRRPGKRRVLRRKCLVFGLLSALLFLPCRAQAYSYYETELVRIGSASGRYSLELWHHSGGYWQVDDGAGKLIKLRDRMIEQAGIVGYLNATQSARWSLPLPENVRAALREGRRVTAEATGDPGLYVGTKCTISGTRSVEVYAIPVFHIATSATLNSFVPGIGVTIPLVSSGYGRNIYAIYGLFCAGDPGLGYFSNAQPSRVVEPYIHPSLIINRLGWFRSGARINIRGTAVSSTGLAVGFLTLARGGAVGLHFDFPITVNFFEEVRRLVTVEDPGAGGADSPEEGGPGAEDPGSSWNKQAPEESGTEEQRTQEGGADESSEGGGTEGQGPPTGTGTEGQGPQEGGADGGSGNGEASGQPGSGGSGGADVGPGTSGQPGNGGSGNPEPAEDPAPAAFDPGDYLLHRAF